MSSDDVDVEDAFLRATTFINARSGQDLRMSDSEKLELYGLYKQALFGDADEKNKPSRFNVLKRAMWEAWWSHKGAKSARAKEEYAVLVESLGEGFEVSPRGPGLHKRRPSMSSMLPILSSENLLAGSQEDISYSSLGKKELLVEIEKLQAEVSKLKVFREYKTGVMSRCRETMTGEDWTERYFVVKPGFLFCYKSYGE